MALRLDKVLAFRGLFFLARAKVAYLRYGPVTSFKDFRGDPMPAFEALGETIQPAWCASAEPGRCPNCVHFVPEQVEQWVMGPTRQEAECDLPLENGMSIRLGHEADDPNHSLPEWRRDYTTLGCVHFGAKEGK